MGLYFSTGFYCSDCKNSLYWDTYEENATLVWVVENKPIVKCGKCGSTNIQASNTSFYSGDMSQSKSENLWQPGNTDLVWTFPDRLAKNPYENEYSSEYDGCNNVTSREEPNFVYFKDVRNKYNGNYVIMFRCDKEKGVVHHYGATKDFTSKCFNSSIEKFQQEYFMYMGEHFQIKDGYIRHFDFRTQEELLYRERKAKHEQSELAWFNPEKTKYTVINENFPYSNREESKVYILREEYLNQGERQGNVIAIFTKDLWDNFPHKRETYEKFIIWEVIL
ncbi:MAG: hypothetical protein FWG64_08455 [Firmicutes bacterium]|nr:hypothetical protein [Bacillota bacterium]